MTPNLIEKSFEKYLVKVQNILKLMIIFFSLDGETPPYYGTCWEISRDTITPAGKIRKYHGPI